MAMITNFDIMDEKLKDATEIMEKALEEVLQQQ
jgi:hypothetical protein